MNTTVTKSSLYRELSKAFPYASVESIEALAEAIHSNPNRRSQLVHTFLYGGAL